MTFANDFVSFRTLYVRPKTKPNHPRLGCVDRDGHNGEQ